MAQQRFANGSRFRSKIDWSMCQQLIKRAWQADFKINQELIGLVEQLSIQIPRQIAANTKMKTLSNNLVLKRRHIQFSNHQDA